MPSKKRIVAFLEDDDWKLWQTAVTQYDMNKSKLLKEIVHAWLFANKLQLQDKN